MRILFAAVVPALLLIPSGTTADTPPLSRRGKLFEIKSFKKVDYDEGRGALQLEFRIVGRETYNDLDVQIYLFDRKKRRIRGGVQDVYLAEEARFGTKKYAREAGTGKKYQVSGYLPGETYTFLYVLDSEYAFAVAEVGNDDEKVYDIVPFGRIEDFIRQ
ncbi:MAG TPA: hypothetical protein PK636_00590 [bacterium]|nr:hypothetical protein [bacterium]HPJ71163.1 hypothetical protein [bacterium]HPQ65158.1 hypothetical protein [bacterium]